MLRYREVLFHGWQALELTNLHMQVILVPELGGRIMGYGPPGEELLYSMPDWCGRLLHTDTIDDISAYRQQMDYQAVGGYKTWLAPQSAWQWPPYLDLDLGRYTVRVTGQVQETPGTGGEELTAIQILLTSPVCRETGIQLTREVCLNVDSRVLEVKQGMRNCGSAVQEFGIWDVTQIQGAGYVIFPLAQNGEVKNFLGNDVQPFVQVINEKQANYAVVQFASYTDFKVGTPYSEGWLLTVVPRGGYQWGYLKRFPVFAGRECGHGCAVEVYDTDRYDYFEVEVHGPVQKLHPGEETSFSEEWEVLCWSEKLSITEILAQFTNGTVNLT